MVRHLSLGNGSLLVNLDDSLRLRDLYFPYAGQENHVQGRKHRIGVQANGFSWIENWDTNPEYKQDTILGESKARNEMEGLEMTFRDTVECEKNVFLREIEVRNEEDYGREVEIFFHQDFDLYGTGMADTCFYHPDHSGMIHYKKNRYVMAEVKHQNGQCGDLEQYGIYRDSPSGEIESGNLNGNSIAQGNVQSAISIKVQIGANSSEKIYYWLNTGKDLDSVLQLNEEVDERIEDFFEQTEMCWRGFIGETAAGIDKLDHHITEQFKRSVLVVRGQTNDNGAITAANDSSNLEYNQDKYGYMWPRDGALVAEVMTEAGYPDLVKPFFDFCEDVIHSDGYMMHKYNPDKSLGSSWHSWIDEEGNKRLPIQEDETALVIWALKRYYEETDNKEILEEKWSSLVEPAAEFMHEYFDEELSLPRPSYDLWEEKHYISTFTVAGVYAGLKAAGEIADEVGEDGQKYLDRAEEIKKDGLENLKSEETKRYVRGIEDASSSEEEAAQSSSLGENAADGEKLDEVSAPLFFLERFGLVDEDDEYFRNTMNAIQHDLSPDTGIGGIARYKGDYYHNVTDDFDRVPGNPWIICTLWVAQHLIETAENVKDLKEAKEYMHWTCENSLETGLLPEQVDPFTGDGKSVSPLTWSHTTFIETALKYSEKKEEVTGSETKRILITGAEGTVGEAAGRYLVNHGYEVIGVGLQQCDEACYTKIHMLDLTDDENIDKLRDLMGDVDAVFHLAWNTQQENFDTGKKWEGNMEMFENTLEASKEAGVPIFINGSSIHAGTGNIPAYTAEASLEDTPEPYRSSIDPEDGYEMRKQDPGKLLDPRSEEPDSPYGESKVETEHRTRESVENGDFDIGVSIRIGGVNPDDKKELEGEPYYSGLYWSHRDLGRTLENILKADTEKMQGYYQFYGVSDNEGRIFSIENPFIGNS
ncbi:NAD-dependent epimerase/dehydratase family protein [Candidatus Nanohaloarchaea archaeon]|nr:NAD-dependent epimerase/dehydratase family protein [Candidatus Nanohaloarchaea archaeon]